MQVTITMKSRISQSPATKASTIGTIGNAANISAWAFPQAPLSQAEDLPTPSQTSKVAAIEDNETDIAKANVKLFSLHPIEIISLTKIIIYKYIHRCKYLPLV